MSSHAWSLQPTDRTGLGRAPEDDPTDAAPLTWPQLGSLARAATRELTWALPIVRREVRSWRIRAESIPAATLRGDALSALDHKRGHVDGAGLFCILPRCRSRNLLRLLVAYEVIWDFLDTVNEHAASAGQGNGRQLHLALVDALDPSRPISDYYRYHPWKDDGGYLRALVAACRSCVVALPSYRELRVALVQEARRAQVLAINHEHNPVHRDAALRAWAARELRQRLPDTSWFELSGAASASMTVHALLALAAEPRVSTLEIVRTRRAYFPWISATTTMLDSYVDQVEDVAENQHSYVAHYPSSEFAVQRIGELIGRSMRLALAKPDGARHAVIVACMTALYLSKDSARTPRLRDSSDRLVRAGGGLTRLLRPLLRLWRIAYDQCSAT